MRIVVTTGGTGGHIHPALVVAKELRKLGNSVLFIGGLYGPESQMAKEAGFDFVGLNVRGFDRSNHCKLAKAILLFPFALLKAVGTLTAFNPDAVIGAGGYASGPATLAASIKKIPLYLMEQNFYPGYVTRKLAGKAKKVFTTFDASKKYLPNAEILVTGNPVREGFAVEAKEKEGKAKKVLLIMGGSQGAHSINSAIVNALPKLKSLNLKIYHQTGKADIDFVKEAYKTSGVEAVVEPFFNNMAELMVLADLAVVRAGASTCAELNLSALPAILVPYRGAGGHQKLNAKVLVENGAAQLFEEMDIEGEEFGNAISELLLDEEQLSLMATNSHAMARPFAAKEIAEEIMKVKGN